MNGKSPDERLDGLPDLVVVEPGSTATRRVLGLANLVRWLDRRYAPKRGATHLDLPAAPAVDEPELPTAGRHPFEAHHLRPELCGYTTGGGLICGRAERHHFHAAGRTPLPVQDESPEAMRAAVAALRQKVEKALVDSKGSADLRDEALAKVKKLRRQRNRARTRLAGALAEIRRQQRALTDARHEFTDREMELIGGDSSLSNSRSEYAVQRGIVTFPADDRAAAYDEAATHLDAYVVSRRVTDWEPDDGKAPETAPASTQSQDHTPEVGKDTPEAPGGSEAVLRVVEAARAWRQRVKPSEHGSPEFRNLIEAVDALGDYTALNPDILRETHLAGWRDGVHWAADEADAQARGHYNLSGDMIDITDHLRACAAWPDLPTLVDRTNTTESD